MDRISKHAGLSVVVFGAGFRLDPFELHRVGKPSLWLSWIFFWRNRFLAARTCSIVALVISVETLQLLVQPMLFDEGASPKDFWRLRISDSSAGSAVCS